MIFYIFPLDTVSYYLIYYVHSRGRSEVGLSRWPVTPEITGSSPVAPVYSLFLIEWAFFFFIEQVYLSGNSAVGSALRSGRRGPRFESGLPDKQL